MHAEQILELEGKVLRLIGAYDRLQAEHACLQERLRQLEERQRFALEGLDRLLQKVQSP